jgi:hypothetical protein
MKALVIESLEHPEEKRDANPLPGALTVGVFFAPVRYRVVKITCSYSEVILQTMKNYKAHYILSWFRPLLRGNSPTSNVFVLKKKNSVTLA